MRFLLAGGIVLLAATLAAGYLITAVVSDRALNSKAGSAAMLVQSLTESQVQELAVSKTLSAANIARLDRLFTDQSFARRFPHLEIWAADGTISYSRTKALIGRRFDPPKGLTSALTGRVAVEYADLGADEHTARNFNIRYLEIYGPLYEQNSGKIIGVVEIHEDTAELASDMTRVRRTTWSVVALFSGMVMLGLFAIVHRGSLIIEAQRSDLKKRAEEAELTSKELLELQARGRAASLEFANLTENFVRRVGADLHDGPAQLLSFAILQISEVSGARNAADRAKLVSATVTVLGDALSEIRSISKSLILPEIEHLGADAIIERVIRQHEIRTGTVVSCELCRFDVELPPAMKTCVYRFVQEGLNNAYRHAGGNGQCVRCRIDLPKMEISVEDKGPAKGFKAPSNNNSGMGLHGLRQRIESFGGTLSITEIPDGGVRLTMMLELGGGLLNAVTDDSHHNR